MGNFKKKIDRKLKMRQDAYDATSIEDRKAMRRPGSRNPHKQGQGQVSRAGARR